MTERELRSELCRIGRSLFERGYVHSSAGNLSARLPDGSFLITPTDACLGFLEPARLAHVDAEGVPLGGDRASKTLDLHRRIYAAAPHARCVLHSHSTHLVALTLLDETDADAGEEDTLLPALTPYFVMKVGRVPRIAYHRPGAPEVAQHVVRHIERAQERGAPIRAVMLDRLGPVVWHETPAAAMAALEELEETARLWWMTGGRAAPLDGAQIDALRRAFGARW